MNELMLFVDGSVDPGSKIGFGAYLTVLDAETTLNSLKTEVKTKKFIQTSSAKLELQSLLWALENIQPKSSRLLIFTDSQTIVGLHKRRDRLENNNYTSGNGQALHLSSLYQQFFLIMDRMDYELIKICGHKKANLKTNVDSFFSLVDKASRKALRECLSKHDIQSEKSD